MIILDILVGHEYNSCCTCHTGHPPCSYCVDTFECEKCGERCNAEDQAADYDEGLICLDCKDMKELEEGLKDLIIDAPAPGPRRVRWERDKDGKVIAIDDPNGLWLLYSIIPEYAPPELYSLDLSQLKEEQITLVKSIIKWLKRFLFSIGMAIYALGLISASLWYFSSGTGQMAVVAIIIGSLALFGAYIAWRIQSILDQA